MESMSGGEVLGTAFITWLKNGEDDINVAKEVVQVVWPRVCAGRSPAHSAWATSCETKVELATKIESWMRVHSTRCDRHLIKPDTFALGVSMAGTPSATTWKVGHIVRCVGNLFHTCLADTNIQGQANPLKQIVSISWESNRSKR